MNKDFYPTPEILAIKMVSKIDWRNTHLVLEPSAGKGDLIEAIEKHAKIRSYNKKIKIKAIEIENDLQGILRNKGITVIDSDFLKYNGLDQFDAIVANFPFSDGDKHLMKAIDIMYSGQIVALINAETIKNPYSRQRKELTRFLHSFK
jgi:16S rRNA A1518/A1519 N6-dimethyltransferase RsmA/KsgA/DIM1 with predicted DNA glycosylase/AP lyase activity